MSIFNTVSTGDNGWNVAEPTSKTTSKITFSVPYMPTEWVMQWKSTTKVTTTSNIVAYAGNIGGDAFTYAGRYSATIVFYRADAPTTSYSDGVFTITTGGGLVGQQDYYELLYI